MNVRNIQISASKGIWATSAGNTPKLRQAFKDMDHVILILSATESRSFQGYAKMMAVPDDRLFPGIWGEFSCRLGASFRVNWLKQCTPPLSSADHIKTHEDLPMRRCRDGQELPSSVGEQLCRFLWQQPDVDLLQGSGLAFEPRSMLDDAPPTPEHESARAPAPPLAIADKKEDPVDDGRSRPAPAKLGSFDQAGSVWKEGQTRPSKEKLAAGSSSVMAAVNRGAMMGMPPPHWAPGWMPHYPAPFYPPHPGMMPHPGMPPHPGMSPQASMAPGGLPPGYFRPPGHGEALPQGYWGEAGTSQPPRDWQGAGGAEKGDKKRARSRSEKRVKKKKVR